jgi:queuine tRNA-ribosyltransferase
LTDSGGYQVYPFRLTENQGRRGEVQIAYWRFVPLFTPENVMEIQRTIGAIIMAFDECTPYPCDYRYAQRSWRWHTAG